MCKNQSLVKKIGVLMLVMEADPGTTNKLSSVAWQHLSLDAGTPPGQTERRLTPSTGTGRLFFCHPDVKVPVCQTE